MKKLLIMTLLCLLPIAAMAAIQKDQKELLNLKKSLKNLPAKTTHVKSKDGLQAVPPAFQGDPIARIMLAEIAAGQNWEQGGEDNYNWTYEPYSNMLIGVSCARYRGDAPNTTRNRGEILCIKYNPNGIGPITEATRGITWWETNLWDVTQPSVDGTQTIKVHEWYNATVVAVNPTKSTDFADVKIAVTTAYETNEPNTLPAARYLEYRWFGFISGQDIIDGEEASSFESIEPTNNRVAPYNNHLYWGDLKGTGAVIDGKPYAFFYGLSRARSAPGADNTSPYNYGIMVLDLSELPAPGDYAGDLIVKDELLPPSITSIFGSALQPDGEGANDLMPDNIGLEVDENGNVYLAFIAGTAGRLANDEIGNSWKNTKTAMVIKTRFDATNPLLIVNPTIDTLSLATTVNYINSVGGIADVTSGGEYDAYTIGRTWSDGINEIPFNIAADGSSYSIIMPLVYPVGNDQLECKLVEVKSSNGNWNINVIDDISIWYNYREIGGYGTADNDRAIVPADMAAFRVATYYNNGNRNDPRNNTIERDELSVSLVYFTHNINIATTLDDYMVVTWKVMDTNVHFDGEDNSYGGIFTPNPACNMYFQTAFTYVDSPYDTRFYNYTANKYYKNCIMLAYKKKGTNDPWKIVNATEGIDNINFNAIYMPKTIESIDEIFCSFIYYDDQHDPEVEAQSYAAAQRIGEWATKNYYSYAFSGIVLLSKDSPLGIVEGDATDFVSLSSAYPNPATKSISVNFTLAKAAQTTLTITDVLGQPISVVVDQFCDAREYNINAIDVSTLATGTYYFTLRSGDVVKTQMFTVIR